MNTYSCIMCHDRTHAKTYVLTKQIHEPCKQSFDIWHLLPTNINNKTIHIKVN